MLAAFAQQLTSDYTGLDIIPFGMISERLGAADASFRFIEVSFTPTNSDCKAAFGAWFNLWLAPLCLVPGKTRQQNFKVFRCALVRLDDISVRSGAAWALVVNVSREKRMLRSRRGRELCTS
jgi:hypothetical protein